MIKVISSLNNKKIKDINLEQPYGPYPEKTF